MPLSLPSLNSKAKETTICSIAQCSPRTAVAPWRPFLLLPPPPCRPPRRLLLLPLSPQLWRFVASCCRERSSSSAELPCGAHSSPLRCAAVVQDSVRSKVRAALTKQMKPELAQLIEASQTDAQTADTAATQERAAQPAQPADFEHSAWAHSICCPLPRTCFNLRLRLCFLHLRLPIARQHSQTSGG